MRQEQGREPPRERLAWPADGPRDHATVTAELRAWWAREQAAAER